MKFSVHLTHYRKAGAPEPAVELAQQAEDLGFEAVWAGDHVVNPKYVNAIYSPGRPDTLRTTQASGGMPDPFILLAVIGGKTSRIRLGFSVLVVPYRPALLIAKQVATLDALTNGRVTLGIGVGWHVQEFEALGVPFAERGPRTDEAIAVCKAVWSGENVSFSGRFNRFDELFVLPRPLQPGGPPIWVGGQSNGALRRAALLGDGWFPTGQSPASYRVLYDEVCRRAATAGRAAPTGGFTKPIRFADRPNPAFDISDPYGALVGTPDQVIAAIQAYREAGVTYFNLSGISEDPAELPPLMERFSREVMPAFA